MKKFILNITTVIALLITLQGSVIAQTCTIQGTVKEGENGAPLTGITLRIGTATSTPDGSGHYIFTNVTSGLVTVEIIISGYFSKGRTILTEAGNIYTVDFWLNAATDFDGNSYSAIEIGSQTWTGENLMTTHYNDGAAIPNVTDVTTWPGLTTPAYSWYNNDEDNAPYGALYNWYAVDITSNGGKNVCPVGWHVPSNSEWSALDTYLGGAGTAGGKMKEAGLDHWASPNTGADNSSGFNSLPAGCVSNEMFHNQGNFAYIWSATTTVAGYAACRDQAYNSAESSVYQHPKENGFSVRCLKNMFPALTTSTISTITLTGAISGGNITYDGGAPVTARGVCWNGIPNPTIHDRHTTDGQGTGSFTSQITGLSPDSTYYIRAYATNSLGTAYGEEFSFTTYRDDAITDIDGNYYNIVKIGSQYWTQENLKTTRYSDGTNIPNVTDNSQWAGLSTPAYSWFNNDETTHKDTYGALYNWYAVNTGNLCPVNWHVASDMEWGTLTSFLGDISSAGGKLKETGTAHWLSPNTGATNETGFTALPGGSRNSYGQFSDFGTLGNIGYWWTATENSNPGYAEVHSIAYNLASLSSGGLLEGYGVSVRCVSDPVVTNTNDSGNGSLRAAIEYANSNPGTDIITFNIPGGGPFTIGLLSPLPAISDTLIIDGYTQPGAEEASEGTPANLLIELDGTNAGPGADGLSVAASNCEIKGLVINRFSNTGIHIEGEGATENIIVGNIIGLNASGTSAMGNGEDGIRIDTKDNIVGGTKKGAGNVISGNGGNGVHIWEKNATGNLIIGNLIGTDITGEIPLGNANAGVSLNTCVDNTIGGVVEGSRNIISGNNIGVTIQGPGNVPEPRLNKVIGNYIGTDITGMKALGNFQGMFIGAASENTIGGSAPGERNIISGNGTDEGHFGILLIDDASNNYIKGNFIGTNAPGTGALPNFIGIHILRGQNNYIGGTDPGEGNLISGNYNEGILMYGGWVQEFDENGNPVYNPDGSELWTLHPSENNIVQGNYIGTDISGLKPLGNSNGIRYGDYAFNNMIGGTEPGAGNVLAFNNIAGIACGGAYEPSKKNSILSNSIHSNNAQGIDLGIDNGSSGVTPNDSIYNETTGKYDYDTDTGPNNLQNFPVIKDYKLDLGAKTVTVGGYLKSIADSIFTLQFFASRVGESTGYGEGEHYLGSLEVTTDADGKATFDETFAINSSWGDVITATATDAQGNTSEFSASVGGMQNQIIPPDMWPFYYKTNENGILRITDGSDIIAVDSAFSAWTRISTANIDFRSGGTTTKKYASANDTTNLVTFVDDQFPFSPGILAVAAKTLKVVPGEEDAHIIDADIVVNPEFAGNYVGVGYDNPNEGYFDAQSIITHEAGHVLGLLHSDVFNSTMYYKIDAGIKVRSLEQDDISWASYRYPASNYSSTFGSISGNITYAYDGNPPVAGALVLAINTASGDTIHSYSDASGNYLVPGLPAGPYEIFIEPLDGSDAVHNLKPGNVSLYLYSNTVYTDYPGEFYSWDESDDEKGILGHPTPDDPKLVEVTPKNNYVADLITNLDTINPEVLSVYPPKDTTDISVTTDIIVTFSEPIDDQTLTSETCYLEKDGEKHGVEYIIIGNNTNMILVSLDSALSYISDYNIHITKGVTDLKGNPLESDYLGKFTTKAKDLVRPRISGTYPEDNADSVFVTEKISVFFTKPMDMSTVENNFSLEFLKGDPAVNTEVEGSYKWDNSNQSLTFIPLRSLVEGTQYTINVLSDAMDLSGNIMGVDTSFVFTTVPHAAPVIVYYGPYNTEDDVTVNTPVVVDFSEPVDPGTITSSTFSLSLNGTPVTGKFEFLYDNARVVFRPDVPLKFSTVSTLNEYALKLTTGISDVSDPPLKMETEMNSTFTTADKPVVPHIYYNEPPAGIVGSLITIAGTGIDPDPSDNIVQFNGVTAAITTATLTSLTAKVPLGALPGMVTMSLTNGITADNSMYFYVIPQSDNPCESIIANSSVGTKSTKAVAVEPNAAYAYVTNPLDNMVSVVDLKDNSVLPITIPVGKTPMKIDINPQGTMAFVTNFNSHDVSVIDLLKNEVIKTIKVGIQPYGIAVTPDGKGVYVANSFSEDISLIDMDPNSGGCDHVIANVQTGTKTKNVAISPDAAMVLVTGDFGLKIIDANPENATYNSVIANVCSGTKTNNVAITPDAGLAVVSTEDGHLLVINLHPENGDYSDAVIANVSTGTKISNVKISPDALFVYVTATDQDEILEYMLSQTGTGSPGGSSFGGLTLIKQNTTISVTAPEGLYIDPKADNLYVLAGFSKAREVTTISLCCGPVAPEKAIGDLIMSIQNMIHSGAIMESHGNLLIKKLNDALFDLQNKKTKSVINDLKAFINQVNTLMDGGKIDHDLGLPLIEAATTLMDQLASIKSAKSLSINALREKEEIETIPASGLGVIYPNPSNTTFTINFDVATSGEESERVMISVYDVSGHIVNTLINDNMQPGHYSIEWNAKYDDGLPAERGTYFIHFQTGGHEMVKKVILVR